MRIVYFGNNWVGWQILKGLKDLGEEVVGLVIHPQDKQKFTSEMIEAAGVEPANIIDGSRLREKEILDKIAALKPDIGLSILFDYILKEELLNLFPSGVINLHPALLPFNRGQYPNVWSIVEGTPSGVTLHYIDKGIDTGDVIAQREVLVEPVDTGKSLYHKLEETSVELFRDTWPLVKAGNAPKSRQSSEVTGSYHRTRDVETIDEIKLDRSYTGRYLIDVLRARTFQPYKGAYFCEGGKKVYLSLNLEYGQADDE